MGSTKSNVRRFSPTDFIGVGELAFAHALRIVFEARWALSLAREERGRSLAAGVGHVRRPAAPL